MGATSLELVEIEEKQLAVQIKKFELEQRKAMLLTKSMFFPKELQGDIASAVIIKDLSERMGISELEVAQNIYIVYGKPAFSTNFLVARLNESGKIKGSLVTIMAADKKSAHCEATDAVSGERLVGMTISLDIARAEGWLEKKGSKWQTMPEWMLKKRAQSFFINEFFPEVRFGLKTDDEIIDTEVIGSAGSKADLNATLLMPKQKQTQPTAAEQKNTSDDDNIPWDSDQNAIDGEVEEKEEEPASQTRTRRTMAEIKEVLIEVESICGESYTRLTDVPNDILKQAEEQVKFKHDAKEALKAANDAQEAVDGTRPFATLDQVNAFVKMDNKHHAIRVKYLNMLKKETTKETAARHEANAKQAVARAKSLNEEADDIFGEPKEKTPEQLKKMYGSVDPSNGITEAIAASYDFIVGCGLPPSDFAKFIEFANIDDDNVNYVEEDEGWIRSTISDWKRQ